MKINPSVLRFKVYQSLPTTGDLPTRGDALIYNIGGPGAKNYKLYFYSGSAWELVTSS